MAYALGTPVGSGCGCSTGTAAADILKSLDIPGLMLHDARSSDLYIDQGATQESVICYMSGVVSPEVSCIKKDGTLQFGSEAKLCFKKDDLERIVTAQSFDEAINLHSHHTFANRLLFDLSAISTGQDHLFDLGTV